MAIHFERTTDLNFVRLIVTHPKVWPWVTDDAGGDPRLYRPSEDPRAWYVLAGDGATLLGMWTLLPLNAICAEVHTCLLPGHGFRRGRQAAREMTSWLWANTPFARIVTTVPAYNRIALKFAQDAGLREYGLNPASILKFGKLHDQHLLGLSRPVEGN